RRGAGLPPLGRNRCWRSPEYGSWFRLHSQNIMGGLQGRQRIAACENEGSDTCGLERVSIFRSASQIDMGCARGLQRLGGDDGVALINGVRRAEAGKLRARRLECRDHRLAIGKAIIRRGLYATRLEECLGKARTRGELGDGAE